MQLRYPIAIKWKHSLLYHAPLDVAEDPAAPCRGGFRFTVAAKAMAVYLRQELKWRVHEYSLTSLGDGSYQTGL